MSNSMKCILGSTALSFSLIVGSAMATTPTGSGFNDTGDILARSAEHTDIVYDIMV